tara:strand:+ start:201 stop:515 length:315 start_codon:yes stop_codon:yes gene_type:complete
MSKKIENTSLTLLSKHPDLYMFKTFIDINKIDKDILAEIFGAPSEIMVIRKLYKNFNSSLRSTKIFRKKMSVLIRVNENIYQSKMSKAEKIYCYTLLNIIIGDS